MAETTPAHTYPQGVTCWVDLEVGDVDAALAFYGELFGWTFTDAMPPDAPGRYVIAELRGLDAAAVGGPFEQPARWNTYIAVDDVDAMTAALEKAGATVISAPADAGPGGRTSTLDDPAGAQFRLWQARRRLGAQVANEPGAWNFSDLHADASDVGFYQQAFGWVLQGQPPWSSMIMVPGYGDHLEATVDPDIRTRQEFAPEGFEDVIGGFVTTADAEPAGWHVTFSVADRDASAAAAKELGATVLDTADTEWTLTARLRDPQGAIFSVSQFQQPQD